MGLRLLCAAGGTGGHLIPALAIAEMVKQIAVDAVIEFVGASGRIEAKVVPEHGYVFHAISVAGFQRRRLVVNLFFPIRLLVALVQSWMLIRRLKPDVVVGTGGYVTGPPLFVASLCGVPTLIQEQNSYPGITTRLLAARAREVHIAFDAVRGHLKRRQGVYLSGNPVRSSVGLISRGDAAAFFGLDPHTRTILVTGGSQGAASINRAIKDILPRLLEDGVQVIWLTGQGEFERITQAISGAADKPRYSKVRIYGFLREMENAWAACDLVVCRAGAITLAEVTRAGIPSLLVPYPFAAADHQTENAKAMVALGAAVVCKDELIERNLYPMVKELLANTEKLQQMAVAARSMAKPEAARIIAEAILRLAAGRHD